MIFHTIYLFHCWSQRCILCLLQENITHKHIIYNTDILSSFYFHLLNVLIFESTSAYTRIIQNDSYSIPIVFSVTQCALHAYINIYIYIYMICMSPRSLWLDRCIDARRECVISTP